MKRLSEFKRSDDRRGTINGLEQELTRDASGYPLGRGNDARVFGVDFWNVYYRTDELITGKLGFNRNVITTTGRYSKNTLFGTTDAPLITHCYMLLIGGGGGTTYSSFELGRIGSRRFYNHYTHGENGLQVFIPIVVPTGSVTTNAFNITIGTGGSNQTQAGGNTSVVVSGTTYTALGGNAGEYTVSVRTNETPTRRKSNNSYHYGLGGVADTSVVANRSGKNGAVIFYW